MLNLCLNCRLEVYSVDETTQSSAVDAAYGGLLVESALFHTKQYDTLRQVRCLLWIKPSHR